MKKTFRINRFYDTNKKNKNQVIKKFIFSAIAVVAFVGSSMANSYELRELKNVLIEDLTCEERAMIFMDYMDPNGTMNDVEAYNYYRGYLESCVRNNGGIGQQPIGIHP